MSAGVGALPAAALARDPQAMRPVLAAAVGAPETGLDVRSVQALTDKPGERCTVVYDLRGAWGRARLVGKFYRRPEVAERVFGWTRGLAETVAGLPAPLALDRDLGLVLCEHVPGRDLRHALADHDLRAARAAGRWLAGLHRSPAPAGLRTKNLGHELSKAGAYAECAAALGSSAATAAARAVGALGVLAGQSAEPATGVVHRDFYYANILWDGARLSVVDLDALALGPVALDVGHFLAHLEVLGLRVAGHDAYSSAGGAFDGAYRASGSAPAKKLVRFGRIATFLKLASIEVARRRPGWQAEGRRLLTLAARDAAPLG